MFDETEKSFNSENKYPRGKPLVEFPVDLNRDEFIEFNSIASTFTGNRRFVNTGFIFFLIAASSFSMLMYDLIFYGKLDYMSLTFLVTFVSISLIISKVITPRLVKKGAGQNYDKTLLEGHNYYGRILIYNDHIEKIGEKIETLIYFKENIYYRENKNMIVIFAYGKSSIVLPSRCMMKSDVKDVKKTLLSAIPLAKQYINEEIEPMASEHIFRPENSEEYDVWATDDVYRITVSYTKDELSFHTRELLISNFVQKLPTYSILSFTLGMATAFLTSNIISGIIVFAAIIVLIFIKQLIGGKIRTTSLFKKMDTESEFIVFEFGPKGIILKSSWEDDKTDGFTWESLKRITEDDSAVRIYTETGYMYIPRRTITDFEKLESLIDKYFIKKSNAKA